MLTLAKIFTLGNPKEFRAGIISHQCHEMGYRIIVSEIKIHICMNGTIIHH